MDDRPAVGWPTGTFEWGKIWQWLHLDRRHERNARSKFGFGSRRDDGVTANAWSPSGFQ